MGCINNILKSKVENQEKLKITNDTAQNGRRLRHKLIVIRNWFSDPSLKSGLLYFSKTQGKLWIQLLWSISKMQSDTLEDWYAIKLEKMPQKRMEYFRLLLDNLSWIEYQFLSGIRDSRKAGSLWGIMRGVQGVRKSMHQR